MASRPKHPSRPPSIDPQKAFQAKGLSLGLLAEIGRLPDRMRIQIGAYFRLKKASDHVSLQSSALSLVNQQRLPFVPRWYADKERISQDAD